MDSSRSPHNQSSACGELTSDEQVISGDVFNAMSLDCPTTPVDREPPPMNLPPGPKSGSIKVKEPESPTHNLQSRVWKHHNDSADGSRDISMDDADIENKPKVTWSNLYGQQLPKTPTRKMGGYRDETDHRTASAKKCPSLNRSRLQSRHHRVRSPLPQRMGSVSMATPTKHVALAQGALLNFNDVLENKERKGQSL